VVLANRKLRFRDTRALLNPNAVPDVAITANQRYWRLCPLRPARRLITVRDLLPHVPPFLSFLIIYSPQGRGQRKSRTVSQDSPFAIAQLKVRSQQTN